MSLAANTIRRTRRVAAASLIAVAALSLTACQDDGKGNAAPPAGTSAATGSSGSGSGGSEGTGKGPSGGSGSSGSAGGDKQGAGSGQGSHAGAGVNGGVVGSGEDGKGVDGTWVGVLKYLAPGKLTVTPEDGMEQAFSVRSDTKVLGAAAICASNGNVTVDGTGYGTSKCTGAQLEKAAKMGSLTVRVTLQSGVATKVVEKYHP
ncbi:hypothetical protein AB0I49_10515 [Streptomyces sp. NPDC050617]|uniref:hypothetical protein n=1 Tax=Streptomyces sp. NPDC050617 TaxID=3154628 RepID=UPI00343812F5